METTAADDQRCCLLEIPPELRLRIYEFVFGEPKTARFSLLEDIGFETMTDDRGWEEGQGPKPEPQLLRTCKLINNEASAAYYNHVTIFVDVEGGNERIWTLEDLVRLGKIEDRGMWLKQLRSVRIWWFPWCEPTCISIHDTSTLIHRTNAFLDAIDIRRQLKTLTLDFSDPEGTASFVIQATLCGALKNIECAGKVIVCPADLWDVDSEGIEDEPCRALAKRLEAQVQYRTPRLHSGY
jgi:hypothetical protein